MPDRSSRSRHRYAGQIASRCDHQSKPEAVHQSITQYDGLKMRTTVTLDPDTQLLIQRAMREREMTFKQAINSAVRSGLAGPSRPDRPAATVARDMGAPLVDMTQAIQLAGELEDEEIVRKLAEGR